MVIKVGLMERREFLRRATSRAADPAQRNGQMRMETLLFGGMGYDAAGNAGYLNDLWEYNVTTLVWTWQGG